MFLAWSYADWVDLLVFAFSKGLRYYIFAQYPGASWQEFGSCRGHDFWTFRARQRPGRDFRTAILPDSLVNFLWPRNVQNFRGQLMLQ